MDYNTTREKMLMPEYGRGVQQMVEHCKTIADRDERTRCAKAIITTMAGMAQQTADKEDFRKKLWNHLAAIARYELDIDYPVEIERMDDAEAKPDQIPYPQQRIKRRHYGAIMERFAEHLPGMADDRERQQLSVQLANHMKRDLSNWSTDSMSDEKVAEDLAMYTDGQVQLDLNATPLISDGELLSTRISTTVKKKKRK